MPYAQSAAQVPPPPIHHYSAPSSFTSSHSYAIPPPGVNPQAHVPYVPTVPGGRVERPSNQAPVQQPEKTYYPPQGGVFLSIPFPILMFWLQSILSTTL